MNMLKTDPISGAVTNIQRYSVNDGYGIRTIVFVSGCSLKCAWCQNPETLGRGVPVLMLAHDSCSGCGACADVCPEGAVRKTENGLVFEREKCASCFACVDECYFGARKRSASVMTAAAAFEEVMKDETFFRESGGGLTISGGEPLLQPEFSRELLRLTREAGIHTAVETAGNAPRSFLESVAEFTDLFLYDIKAMDEQVHRAATGASNRTILSNLLWLAESGVEIMVRVPLIPGINDGAEFEAIARYVAMHPGLKELHILPYHDLGVSKYRQLGLDYPAAITPDENDREVSRCALYAENLGLRVNIGGAGFAKREDRFLNESIDVSV